MVGPLGGGAGTGAGTGAGGGGNPDMNGGELSKAQIEILNGKHAGKVLEVDYNPPDCGKDKPVKYGKLAATGSGAIEKQFCNREPETFDSKLIYDSSETNEDVRDKTDQLNILVEVDPELHSPPLCNFIWGGGVNFRGHVHEMQKEYTMFLKSGIPIRAEVTLTIQEYETAEFHMAQTSPESTDKTKYRTVTDDKPLWVIAAEEYEDPEKWSLIAETNDIKDPLDLSPGDVLELPPL